MNVVNTPVTYQRLRPVAAAPAMATAAASPSTTGTGLARTMPTAAAAPITTETTRSTLRSSCI